MAKDVNEGGPGGDGPTISAVVGAAREELGPDPARCPIYFPHIAFELRSHHLTPHSLSSHPEHPRQQQKCTHLLPCQHREAQS